ncbi:HD domain-containing phosphohydrolase [Vibrio hannami]|uniref:HD domain-containing phosphohydrolase n=1 Tax=Vibrio hannami TaxID=2717094 RepID=UPI00240EB30F|nr:HD domain-containing phosphohydrolase [Vibrio hannami]MDG3088201.1 HD domain-containing phosphohydrolase [Vibrio hannami]
MIKMKYNASQTFLFYLIAAVLYGTYGGRVCPFLETLTYGDIMIQTGSVFTLLFLIRHYASIKGKFFGFSSLAKLDSALFFAMSIPFALYYSLVYEFPADSNAKVLFGMTIFGFLTGFVLELKSKIVALDEIENNSLTSQVVQGTRQSMVKQAITLVLVLLISLTVTLTMIAVKDVYWLMHNPMYVTDGSGQISIIKEFIYISAVLIGYSILIMTLWSTLMKRILAGHETALEQVTSGQISERLPVYSNDELGAVASMTNDMLDSLEESQGELEITRDAAIVGLSALAESRDNETGAHILRTQEYVKALAENLSTNEKHQDLLTENYIDLLYKSAPLHDVGKVGIPDSVLLKPGKLTDEEFDTMKQHPNIGAEALSVAEKQLGSSSFLRLAREIALTHHEKWDGSGYPNKLSGDDIPLSGRLMALADVYDALISKRVYKPAFSHEKAKEIILEGSGTHFDPAVVQAFLSVESSFIAIADKHKDKTEPLL